MNNFHHSVYVIISIHQYFFFVCNFLNMFLLLSITVISFLIAFVHIITKPIVSMLTSATVKEKQLMEEIAKLKNELETIPMRKEYTTYVKVERKIVTAQAKLNELRQANQTKRLLFQYGVPYGVQALLSLVLLLITIVYRYTPIAVFDGTQYNLIPFGPILRFPTGIDGAVSVPFWIFVNNYVSRHVASYVK